MAQKRNPVSLRLQTRLHGREKRFASSWFTDLFYPQLCTFDTRARLYIGHLFDKGGNWSGETAPTGESETRIPETCLGIQFSYRRCSILSVILNLEKEEIDCAYSLNQNIRKNKPLRPVSSLGLETNLLKDSTRPAGRCAGRCAAPGPGPNAYKLSGRGGPRLYPGITQALLVYGPGPGKNRSLQASKSRAVYGESLSTIFSSKWCLIRFMLFSRYTTGKNQGQGNAFIQPPSNLVLVRENENLSKKATFFSANGACKSLAIQKNQVVHTSQTLVTETRPISLSLYKKSLSSYVIPLIESFLHKSTFLTNDNTKARQHTVSPQIKSAFLQQKRRTTPSSLLNNFAHKQSLSRSSTFVSPFLSLQSFEKQKVLSAFKSKYKYAVRRARKDKYFETSFYLIRALSISQSVEFCLQSIVFLYKKRQSFQKIHEYIFARLACNKYVRGARILCSGRLGGRSKSDMRSKKQSAHFGETALTMFSSRLAFASTGVDTSFGKIGIKLWICYR